MLVTAISVAVGQTFGMQLFDKENLLGSGALILTVAVNGVLLLLNHWSIGANQFYAYSKLKPHQIDRCTHVRAVVTNKKQNTVKQFIVPLIVQATQLSSGKVN